MPERHTRVTDYTDELVSGYRYLIMRVNTYTESSPGIWEVTSDRPQYLTLINGNVSLTVPGFSTCRLAVDDGSFRAHPGAVTAAPAFYASVE